MKHPRATRARRLVVVVGLSLFGLIGAEGTAGAHASLVSSQPADGSSLSSPPRSLTLDFDSEIDLARSSAQVTDQHNLVVGDTAAASTRHLTITGAGPFEATSTTVVIGLPELGAGAYQVRWRVVDALDLHVTRGAVVFGIGQSAGPSAAVSDPWPPWLPAAASWLQLLAVVLVIGALTLGWALLPSVTEAGPAAAAAAAGRRLRSIALISVTTAGVAGLAVFVLKTHDVRGGISVTGMLSTTYGRRWLGGEGALGVLAVILALHVIRARRALEPAAAGRAQPRRPGLLTIVGAVVLVMAFVLAQTMTSHLAATAGGSLATTVAALVHLLAAGAWVGSLLAFTACAPLFADAGTRPFGLALLRRFGWTAVPCLAAVVVSGLVLAGHQVLTVDALLFTHYGQLLIAKVALVGAVGLLGARNASSARMARCGISNGPRRALVIAECVVIVIVIGLAGALANGKPARGPDYEPVSSVLPPQLNTQIADLLIGLSIRPDRPGPDFVSLSIQTTRVPAPAPIAAVTVGLTSPGAPPRTVTEQAVRTTDGSWTDSTTAIDRPGPWAIHVVIHRPGLKDVTLDTTWDVLKHPSSFTQRSRVSETKLRPLLDDAALALTGVAMLGIGLSVAGARRNRRRGNVPAAPVEPESVHSSR
jgi:copper transport protein